VTWAKKLTDYAATDPRYPERSKKGVDHKTTFSEGVNVGYRWFDKQNVEPLFAFGHGLSFTTFEYSGLKVAKAADGGLDVSLTIRNTGDADSDEVPQAYLSAPNSALEGVQFPVRKLVAFDRVHIPAGQSQAVTLHVPERQLQYWSTKEQKWATLTATRTVSVGGSSRSLPLQKPLD
jgi:beta-glucosidase